MEDQSEAFGLNQRASVLDSETVSETDVLQHLHALPLGYRSRWHAESTHTKEKELVTVKVEYSRFLHSTESSEYAPTNQKYFPDPL